jgi:hypothetical protein
VSGELSAASPERLSMASPGVGSGGKRVHPLPYGSDVNQSRMSLALTCGIYSVLVFKCCYQMLI